MKVAAFAAFFMATVQQAVGMIDHEFIGEDRRSLIKSPRGLAIEESWIASAETTNEAACKALEIAVMELKSRFEGASLRSDSEKPDAVRLTYECFIHFKGSKELAEAVARMPLIDEVEQDMVMIAEAAPESWGLDRVDQKTLPLDKKTFQCSHTGIGINVFIVDTGINKDHNDFGGRANFGGDFVNESQDEDGNGHGTHCAGTVGSNSYGIAREATLWGVKVLSSRGSGSTSGVIKGVAWAVDHQKKIGGKKAGVISMSLGGGKSSSMNKAVIDAAKTMIVVVAAGNENQDACNVSPASAGGNAMKGGVITVGSTTYNKNRDERSSFSNYGKCTDIFAPGSNIKSTWKGSKTATNTISGTSMATPHVAGVAAVLLDKHNGDKDAAIGELFALVQGGLISDAKSDSPNKLLQVPLYTGPPTPPTKSPTMPPTFPSPTLCVGGVCAEYAESQFGPKVGEGEMLTGPLVVSDSEFLCEKTNQDFTGKIVLVKRGECYFFDKVKNAERNGAVGVLIYMADKSAIFPPAYYEDGEVFIPSCMISLADAQRFMKKEGQSVEWGVWVSTQAPTSPTKSPTSAPTTPTKSPTPSPTATCAVLNKKSCKKRSDCTFGRIAGTRRKGCGSIETKAPTPAPTDKDGEDGGEAPGGDTVLIPAGCPQGTLAVAEATCESFGRTLCPMDVLRAEEPNSECNFDNQFVWTSDQCNKGKIRTFKRNGNKSRCQKSNKRFPIKCC